PILPPPTSTLFPYTTLFRSTQEVIFTDVGPHDDPAALGKAETGGQGTGGLLFNAVIHVHLVVHARDRGGLDVHFLKEAQALQTGDRKSTRLNSSDVKISYAV